MNTKMQAGETRLANTQAGGAGRSRVKAALCLGILALAQQTLMAATKPVIWSAAINAPANLITIIGQHFAPASGAPVVTLDSVQLTLFSWNNTTILASTPVGLGAGSYALTVSNGVVATFEVANDPRFGINTSLGRLARGRPVRSGRSHCTPVLWSTVFPPRAKS